MKIATWNVNSIKVRLPQVLRWLEAEAPDLMGLQETKVVDEVFPAAELEEAGYHAAFSGQKAYNGVALLSREPAADVVTDLPGMDDPQRRVLGATVGGLRFLNLYVPNGQSVGSDKYAYKLEWLDRCREYVEEQLRRHERLVVVGDFNVAPEDRDVHDPSQWEGSVLFSKAEREAFAGLLAAGLTDAFRLFPQEEGPSPGGTTAWAPSAATSACASTTSCCQRTFVPAARVAASTGSRASGRSPPTTPRCWRRWGAAADGGAGLRCGALRGGLVSIPGCYAEIEGLRDRSRSAESRAGASSNPGLDGSRKVIES